MATKVMIKNSVKHILKTKNTLNLARNASVWTKDFVCHSPFSDVALPSLKVNEYIWQHLERWSDKTAAVCGTSGRSYTYHQLYKYSQNLATRLRKYFCIEDHDVICVMLPNLPEYPLVVLGALQAGAVVTTLNPIYTAYEVSRQLLQSKTKIIISIPNTVEVIREALVLAKIDIPIICIDYYDRGLPDKTVSLKELIEGQLIDTTVIKDVGTKPEDVCLLPYSSGTTGMPKGVEITHRNIVANWCQQNETKIRHYNETTESHQDRTLVVLPLFHIYGLSTLMLHKLSVGAQLVTVSKFHSNTFLDILDRHKISLFYAAPPIVLFLASHPEVKYEHLAQVNMFMCGAAPLPLADVEKLFKKVKHKFDFLQGYGLTETAPLVSLMKRNQQRYESVGFALPNTELSIVDSEMQRLGPNQIGELLVRGPQVMKGYRDNVEATKNAITEDGWFKTGDLANIAEDGSIIIQDRLKELIKVKGFQVPPAELESVLKEHPMVLDVAVIGKPHHRFGELPKAFVVVKEGHKVEEKEIINFVSERVAEYKKIHEVMFVDAIPKNPSGKILRRVLKEKYC